MHFPVCIKYIRFADDIVLLAEDERMLKNMLIKLNDRYEDYGMKININKTKIMVIGRKQRKLTCKLKMNLLNKCAASNTCVMSVATRTAFKK